MTQTLVAPGTTPSLDDLWQILPEEAGSNEQGELTIGGCSTVELAKTFGTPLQVIDETGLRRQMRRFADGLAARWPNSEVLFASKSLPAVAMYAVAAAEGLCLDVAGAGEIRLALAAGVDPSRIFLHGNAKSREDLELALRVGVGTIIIDNFDDIDRLEQMVTAPQSVLLRVIPEVQADTHASIFTGGKESKFGLPLDQAAEAIGRIEQHPLLRFDGVHVHIGSQILDARPFGEAVAAVSSMGPFPVYDVGGGLGVKYTFADQPPTVEEYLDSVTTAARKHLPADAKILIEPGRSVVARAGITLYEVSTIKETAKTFVAVNGGLADLINVALTGQRYEPVVANRLHEPWDTRAQIVGRQCESGDLMVDNALISAPRLGDTIALAATGAYSYTFSNNYNGALKPAIVFVTNGEARLAVRRESYEDLLRCHEPAASIVW